MGNIGKIRIEKDSSNTSRLVKLLICGISFAHTKKNARMKVYGTI